MCKSFCRIIATIYMSFICGLLFTASYYSLLNDNTNYLVIPLAVIAEIIFILIIRNIIIIIRNYYNTATVVPIIQLREVRIDDTNFVKISINE